MNRLLLWLALSVSITGCAHLGFGSDSSELRRQLWNDSQNAFALGEFATAELGFETLAADFPNTLEGRESLFYLGTIRLDPRNPEWDSEPAEAWLERYLAMAGEDQPRIYRHPEAATLHEIARQLNLPPSARITALQPGEPEVIEQRVVVPAAESREQAATIQRLEATVTERDARIQQLEEELERIRRTLTGTPRP